MIRLPGRLKRSLELRLFLVAGVLLVAIYLVAGAGQLRTTPLLAPSTRPLLSCSELPTEARQNLCDALLLHAGGMTLDATTGPTLLGEPAWEKLELLRDQTTPHVVPGPDGQLFFTVSCQTCTSGDWPEPCRSLCYPDSEGE